MNKIYIIYLLLFIISFSMETFLFPCKTKKKIKGILISLIHHFMSIYFIFGSILFKNYAFHLIVLIVVGSVWMYSGMCPLTTWYNEACNYNKKLPFHELSWALNNYILKINKNFRYYGIIIVILYDIVNIYISYKNKNTSKIWNLYN